MEKIRTLLSSTRREFLLQCIFTIIAILIPNQRFQLTLFIGAYLLISFLVSLKPSGASNLPRPIELFIRWIVISGTSYFTLALIWVGGAFLLNETNFANSVGDFIGIVLFVFAIIFSMALLMLPLPIIVKNLSLPLSFSIDESPVITLYWLAGLLVFPLINASGVNSVWLFIPIVVWISIRTPVNGLWMAANILSGGLYVYIWSLFINPTQNLMLFLLASVIASLSSAIITGLALLIKFEFESKKY